MQKIAIRLGFAFALLTGILLSLALFAFWPFTSPIFAQNSEIIDVQAAPSAGEFSYIVQRGDTLYSLARRFGTTVDALMRLNNIANPNQIYVGQRLRIPGSASTATPTPTPTPISTSVWTPPVNPIELFSPVAQGIYHSPIEI